MTLVAAVEGAATEAEVIVDAELLAVVDAPSTSTVRLDGRKSSFNSNAPSS